MHSNNKIVKNAIGVFVKVCEYDSKVLLLKFVSQLNGYDYCLVRQRILAFLQDKNVKVSLFLQSGIQNKNDGSFVLQVDTTKIPTIFDVPGTVR